ncbi:toll/interleukin-1 receptor domain-containing protein [Actinocrispum wychmicini]|uniref:TIR domain-containing protein n=1 Tax=Actinocrispum wychmicini TaxID=1213861 RepID=A0A4R2JLD1_9PSEU|nr:toll/interleukin-1 receptor domain-containing protein [Actinocrispum wychmicini]TCO60841.1 TIR domain-containing protein [Actinocrispum wychmicini]
MTAVFVNYRTSDEPSAATLLKRGLSERLGEDTVFLASDRGIPPGNDFERELLHRVRGCRVLLAVVGPRWLTPTGPDGQRPIDQDGDWVRREIAEAFAHDIRVIPILVGATKRLTGETLPPAIAPITTCQYLRLRHHDLDSDLDTIADALTKAIPELARPGVDNSPTNGQIVISAHATGHSRIYQAVRDQTINESPQK